MIRWRQGATRCAATLVLLLLALAPLHLTHAQDSEALKIRLEVTDVGFSCVEGCNAVHFGGDQWEFTIEVEQGQLVELTFVFAHQGYVQEEHIMVLKGYNLEWDQIDFHNREATLQFIADQSGTFDFKCDLDCELHDYMRSGHLKVQRGGSGGDAPAFTPTILTLSPSSWVTAGGTITLMAVLKNPSGAPVSKAEVHFYLDAEFAGIRGKMAIGTAKTDDNGVAFLDFEPTLATRQQTITARFDGLGIYDESEEIIEIEEVGVPPSAYTMAPVGLESIRSWAPLALGLTILAVWATFGFILYQAFGIFWVRGRR